MVNTSKNKILNVPNLRFPEFSGEWESLSLSELLEFFSTNSLSWDQLEYEKGTVRNLHYGLIHVGLPTLVDITKNRLPMIKKEFIPRNYVEVKEGDIAFADASEDTNDVAKAIEFLSTDEIPTICGLHTIHGRDKLKLTELGYKGYYFSSDAFHNQVKKRAQGTKIFSVSPKLLSECRISIPSKLEQKKIASLLLTIDERIATQSKIIEDLEKLKSAIRNIALNYSLSKNVSLGDIADIYQPQTIDTMELDVKYPYNVYGANGIIGKYHTYNHETSQICITCRGNTCGVVNFTLPKSWITGNAMVINTDNYEVNKRFLFHYLSNVNFTPIITGSGQPQIVRTPLIKLKIKLPSIEEQEFHAHNLDTLYTKINNERILLNLLVKQKQYLLHQMFI